MKKLLFVLFLGAFVACNESASTESVIDSTAEASIDSVQMASDTMVNHIDSTADAKIDSLQK